VGADRLAEGTVIGDAYRIVRALSAGGMGEVYVAEQLSTGKLRALKLMHHRLQADPKLRERFVKEARVASSIESAHVVEVIGAGVEQDSGTPWLAMELLDGEDLGE
jgi:serine/threonine protein kinase